MHFCKVPCCSLFFGFHLRENPSTVKEKVELSCPLGALPPTQGSLQAPSVGGGEAGFVPASSLSWGEALNECLSHLNESQNKKDVVLEFHTASRRSTDVSC